MAGHGVGVGKFCVLSGLLAALLIAPVPTTAAESTRQSITIDEALAQRSLRTRSSLQHNGIQVLPLVLVLKLG